MPIENILSSLGTHGNADYTDANLTQGQELLGFSDEYVRVLQPHLIKLQLSTSPKLSSIVESLNATESVNAKHVDSKAKISTLEERFNRTLSEYARTNDQINELLLRNHHKGLDTYNGMIVTTDGNKSFVYVNDYGFTHKYPKESQSLLDKSCEKLKRAKVNQSVLERLEKGRAMVPEEPCGVAGKNVRRGSSDEHAWISIDGLKHVYPSHVWEKKSKSCDIPVVALSETAYDAIPSGSAMTTSAECERGAGAGVPPALWARLYELNQELAHLTALLTKEVDGLVATDLRLTKELAGHKTQLAQHTDSLGKDREKIQSIKRDFRTVVGVNNDARIQMRSEWMHYIVWVLLAVTVVGIVVHTIGSNEPGRTAQVIVLIAALIIIYCIARWIDRHYI